LKGDADLTPILPFAFRSTAWMADKLWLRQKSVQQHTVRWILQG